MFGFSTVNRTRTENSRCELFATTTRGGFRLSSKASKILRISVGEHVMFLSNVDAIDAAIAEHNEQLVAFCESRGLDIDSPEATVAIHAEFDEWAIAKGIKEFDGKGFPLKSVARYTVEDKKKFVEANFDQALSTVMENGTEDIKEALSAEGVTKEQQVEILAQFVETPEVDKYRGSKTGNMSNMSGIGVTLNFSDSTVWNALKSDLLNPKSVVRKFMLDEEKMQQVIVHDGFKDVEVTVLPLGEYVDEEAKVRGMKSVVTEETAETEAVNEVAE